MKAGEADGLIVYGSLAPGGSNHYLLARLTGEWLEGWITGRLTPSGWGAALGYPALVWNADGPRVHAWMLKSPEIAAHWAQLDEFEGPAYARVRIPFLTGAGVIAQGYCYVAARPSP